VHGSQEKRTPPTKAWDNDGKFEWKDQPIELWDGEAGETVEFFVNIERNGTRWRDSMATISMSDFRQRPEHRFTVSKPLGPIGSVSGAASSKGTLLAVISYTEDCLQPTLFQSLFCTAFVNCGGAIDLLQFDVGGIFLPNLFSVSRSTWIFYWMPLTIFIRSFMKQPGPDTCPTEAAGKRSVR
jgi:hypothetical protein